MIIFEKHPAPPRCTGHTLPREISSGPKRSTLIRSFDDVIQPTEILRRIIGDTILFFDTANKLTPMISLVLLIFPENKIFKGQSTSFPHLDDRVSHGHIQLFHRRESLEGQVSKNQVLSLERTGCHRQAGTWIRSLRII